MDKFLKNFWTKKLSSDVDAGKSSKKNIKTDKDCVETDALPEPARPLSGRPSDSNKEKLGKKSQGKSSRRKIKDDDDPTEMGCSDEEASDGRSSRTRMPTDGFYHEEQHRLGSLLPQPTLNISNIVNCSYVRIGNETRIINSPINLHPQKDTGSPSEDIEDARQEVIERIKKGFSCLDSLTAEDKRTVQNNYTGKWQTLATSMGYSPEDIARWEKDPKFPKKKNEAIGKLLDKWERTSAPTVGVLCTLLQSCNETQTAQLLALTHC